MNALLINGSPHVNGNTARALREIEKVFVENGIETHIVNVGNQQVSGCSGCYACVKTGECVKKDIVNEVAPLFEKADCLIVGTPVHYASPCGTVISFMDRLFYSSHADKRFKVGASVAIARRGGTTASLEVLDKYFSISGMPIVPSCYWNIAHGNLPGDIEKDEEGLQTMRTLARNAVFLMKSIALGKEAYGLPEPEKKIKTNFIR